MNKVTANPNTNTERQKITEGEEELRNPTITTVEDLKNNTITEKGEEENKFKLNSADDVTFEVEASIVKEMGTVQSFIDASGSDLDASMAIPLHNVTSRELRRIIEYCSEHCRLADDLKALKEFDEQFEKALSLGETKELLLAANYLDMKKLLEFLSGSIAKGIENKSVEFAREFFGVVNDYTPKEEAEYRRTHSWAFENIDQN